MRAINIKIKGKKWRNKRKENSRRKGKEKEETLKEFLFFIAKNERVNPSLHS
jgi:hypothetical protein